MPPEERRLNAENRSHFTAFTTTTVLGGATKCVSGLTVVLPSSGSCLEASLPAAEAHQRARRAQQRRQLGGASAVPWADDKRPQGNSTQS